MIVFLCGCNIGAKLDYGYKRRWENGREVCPEHGVPEYGYRTKEAIAQGKIAVPGGVASSVNNDPKGT